MQKNRGGVQAVLNQMKNRGVEPDADTFSYLISNSDSEKDISKVNFNILHPPPTNHHTHIPILCFAKRKVFVALRI